MSRQRRERQAARNAVPQSVRRPLFRAVETLLWVFVAGLFLWRVAPQVQAAVGWGSGGTVAPAVTFDMLDGGALPLRELKGQVVLVNFWATWCPPCRAEMPGFQKVYDARRGAGFTVLGVSTDEGSRQQVASFLRDHAIRYPVAVASSEVVAGFGGVSSLPTSFLIDRQGRVRYTVRGIFAEVTLRAAIDRLLAEGALSMEGGQVSFGLAFAAGLASFLSPCVFPVVPGYVGFVTGVTLDDARTSGGDGARWRSAVHAALFILGFSLLFVALGASATALGGVIRRALPLIQQVGGAVVVLFGLYMLGLVRLPLLMQEKRVQLAAKPAGMVGSVIAGVAFGAGWTPCIGPVLATILLYAGLGATVLHGAALLAAYALGLGIPFFVAAVAFNWFLSRTRFLRRWLVPIERAAGAVMVVAGALLFSGRLSALSRFLTP